MINGNWSCRTFAIKLVRKKFANILCVNTVCLLFAIIVTLFVYNAKKFCYNVNIREKY